MCTTQITAKIHSYWLVLYVFDSYEFQTFELPRGDMNFGFQTENWVTTMTETFHSFLQFLRTKFKLHNITPKITLKDDFLFYSQCFILNHQSY